MSYYFPQAAVRLRILFEDYTLGSDALNQKQQKLNVVAKDVSVSINEYKKSDTFSMELDFKSFPFDPRSIRACGVEIFIKDMRSIFNLDGSPNTIIPSARFASFVSRLNSNEAIIAGFVDQDEITLDENKQVVKFEGRDFTALLIDQKYQTPDGKTNPLTLEEPIDIIIGKLLANFKATQEIKILNKTDLTVLPTPAQYDSGLGSSKMATMKSTTPHETYWEIIQDVVSRAGLICYMHLDKLVIATPKNQSVKGKDVEDIKLIYGKNVKNLTLKRRLGRLKSFGIELRCRKGKEVIKVRIPDDATPEWALEFGIARKEVRIPILKPNGDLDGNETKPAPYYSFPVPAERIANHTGLVLLGQTVYEQYSLQQLEGTLETMEMVGRGTHGKEYDLTNIEKGQSLKIEIDTDDLAGIKRMSTEIQRVDFLRRRNYSPAVASLFAKTLGKFSPRFFIKSYTIGVNETSGFSLKINFVNIVELGNIL